MINRYVSFRVYAIGLLGLTVALVALIVQGERQHDQIAKLTEIVRFHTESLHTMHEIDKGLLIILTHKALWEPTWFDTVGGGTDAE
jgi:hypothetical protein